jgi:hypothetical protein
MHQLINPQNEISPTVIKKSLKIRKFSKQRKNAIFKGVLKYTTQPMHDVILEFEG